MSPRKKIVGKVSEVETFRSDEKIEGEIEILRATYDDTSGLIKKDVETLKWGEVYYISKKSNLSTEDEYPEEIQVSRISRNISS
jgi:hypothetical protein